MTSVGFVAQTGFFSFVETNDEIEDQMDSDLSWGGNTPERWSRKKNRQRKTERQEACDGEGSLPGGPEDGLAVVGQRCHHATAET